MIGMLVAVALQSAPPYLQFMEEAEALGRAAYMAPVRAWA